MSLQPETFKTPEKAKQFESPSSVLQTRISESSTNSNTPPRIPKKSLPPPTQRTESKARKKLFTIPETVSTVAKEANKQMSSNKKETLLAQLNGPPVPPNVGELFKTVDSMKNRLNPASQTKLRRARSVANSVLSLTNNDPNKIQAMFNVQNNLEELRSELKIIPNFEKQLKRVREKHGRATAMIKELKLGEPVPIIIRPTAEINRLTKEMEKLKRGGDLNRSRLLGLIVSLAKKEKAAMGALSKIKNTAVAKNKNVTEMNRKLKEYATAVESYEARIKELSKSPKTTTTSTQTLAPKPATIRSLVTNKSVNKILKAITERNAKAPTTPPGITKTNLERLLQPFKQPVTVTVAPTISVKGGSVQATGGSAKQGIMMLKSNTMQKKKKKTPPPKPQYLKTPGTIRREKEKARSIATRKQLIASMRTPTKGQRKTHVIQMIDRVLRRMKAPKDVEKKLIKVYEALSEKQIKSLFGGRSPEFVKKTLKKQVEYLKKKR